MNDVVEAIATKAGDTIISIASAAEAAEVKRELKGQAKNSKALTLEELEASTSEVRLLYYKHVGEYRADMQALNQANDVRKAALADIGYKHAVKLMQPENRELLLHVLAKCNIVPQASDESLLRAIAKYQLGKMNDDNVWTVPGGRHRRLGNLYVAFAADPKMFPVDGIEEAYLTFKGREDGILRAHAKALKNSPSAVEFGGFKSTVWLHRKQVALAEFDMPEAFDHKAAGDGEGFVLALVATNSVSASVVKVLPAKFVRLEAAVEAYINEAYPALKAELDATAAHKARG